MTKNALTAIFTSLILVAMTGCIANPDELDEQNGASVEDVAEDVAENVVEDEQELIYEPAEPCDPEGGCSGGGTGGTGSTGGTTYPINTTSSYLNASARSYLASAGVVDTGSVGATQWVDACKVMAYQGAVTFNSGVTKSCSWANPRPGWIILEVDYKVLTNWNNRGSASVSATNGPVTINTLDFGSKFNTAISLAVTAGDITAQSKLQLEYQRLNGYSFSFNGAGNQLVATVTANGGLFERSKIEILARAKLLRIY